MDACGLLASGLDLEIDIGDFDARPELDALLLQPLLQQQHERFILVVLGELQRAQIWQSADMMDKLVEIELHLRRGMPFLKGEHSSPIEPKIAVEEILAEHFVDATFSISRRVARKTAINSRCAGSLKVKRPSVWASCPRFTVARCSE
ncbi:hypothetical protein ABIA00_003152 [Bradyrhizobium ottawaense]